MISAASTSTVSSRPPLAVVPIHALALALISSAWNVVAADPRRLDDYFDDYGFKSDTVAVLLGVGAVACLVALYRTWRPGRGARPKAGTAWRLALAVLMLGTALYHAYLQPFHESVLTAALGLTAALWGVVFVLLQETRVFVTKIWRRVDLVLFNLCLFIFLAEGTLRLVATLSPSPLLERRSDRPAVTVRKKKETNPAGKLRYGFPLNSEKYYDDELEKPDAGTRIVAMLGDSFSYGVVPHFFHFSTVAERRLAATEIYNIGLPGLGPYEYLFLLENEVLAFKPDLIAVNLFVGNDIRDANRQRFSSPVLRFFYDRESLLLYEFPRRLFLTTEHRRDWQNRNTADGLWGEDGNARIDSVDVLLETYPWLADPELEEPAFFRESYHKVEIRRAAEICDPYAEDYEELYKALRRLRRAAGQIPLVVHLIPDDFQINDRLWKRVRRTLDRELKRDLAQERIRRWLDREAIPYLDLLPVLRRGCAKDSTDKWHCFHFRDTHFNRRGNWVAGVAMAEFLAGVLGTDLVEPAAALK